MFLYKKFICRTIAYSSEFISFIYIYLCSPTEYFMFGFNLPFFPNGSVENSFALKFSIFDVLELFFFNLDSLSFPNTLSSNSSICFFTKSTALFKFSFALERTPFILFPYCEFYFGYLFSHSS